MGAKLCLEHSTCNDTEAVSQPPKPKKSGRATQDLRADRQPEFTQLDLELAFADADTIMAMMERLLAAVFQEVSP